MRFTFTPHGVAGVFLRQRCPTAGPKEQEDLGRIIDDAWKQGIYVALEHAKEVYRSIHPGGCRMYSQGEACKCFLCQIDDSAAEVKGETAT